MTESLQLHPETGNFDSTLLPPTSDEQKRLAQEKHARGEELTVAEKMKLGRDETVRSLGEVELRSDHAYRAIGRETLDAYRLAGSIVGFSQQDEYIDGKNNAGVDWYLGGAAPKYGDIILETPASPEYFTLATDFGTALAKDSLVRHIKSSGSTNPVPMERVTVISRDETGNYRRQLG